MLLKYLANKLIFNFKFILMDLYKQQLLDHYQNPHNFRILDDATHEAYAVNPLCGDDITVFLKIKDQMIEDISFQSQSCLVTMATASIVTDFLKGKTLKQISELSLDNIIELLGTPLTSSRQQCALVVINAVKKAISQ